MSDDEDGIGGGSGMGGIQSLGIVNALKTGDSTFLFQLVQITSHLLYTAAAAVLLFSIPSPCLTAPPSPL